MPPVPQSNVEKYLSVIAGHGGEVPSEPASRVEYCLNEIVKSGGIGGKLKPEIVTTLPVTGVTGILYLIRKQGASGENVYDEYIWIDDDSKYELLGQTDFDIDLSEYVRNTRKVGGVPLSSDVDIQVTAQEPVISTNTSSGSTRSFEITHKDSGVTAGSKGDTTNQTPAFGGTFKVLSATVDAKGRVTALGDHTARIPDAEATVSAKGLMSAADKMKLDTLIDATLSNMGKAADAKVAGDKIVTLEAENTLLRELIEGIDAPIYRNASGNPVTFGDGSASTVRNLSVTMIPIQTGSGDPSPDNIRPVSGVSSVSVTRMGKNQCPLEAVTTTRNGLTFTVDQNAGTVTVNGTASATTVFFLNSYSDRYVGNNWILSGCPSGGNASVFALRVYEGENGYVTETGSESTMIGTENLSLGILIRNGVTMSNKVFYPMIRRASDTDATYEPYRGQSVTVPLVNSNDNPLTVYGGTLDVTTGELAVTWANIPSYNGETLPGVWISDRDVYTPGETPTTGAQVAYKLATPVTYNLTPQQLSTLYGYNSVSTDAETLSVTYRADPSSVFGGG